MMKNRSIMTHRIAFVIFLIFISVMFVGCPGGNEGKEDKEVHSGEYYSFQCDNGGYKVLKVLLAEENLIHICYYNNIFEEKPSGDVIQSLYFGKNRFNDAFISEDGGQTTTGRKHMALTLENWKYWKPHFLSNGEVTSDELKAYEEWKNGDRYVSGLLTIPNN